MSQSETRSLDDENINWTENIETLRRHQGWSRTLLSEKLGVTPSALRQCMEINRPSLKLLLSASKVFGVRLDDLIYGTIVVIPVQVEVRPRSLP